MLNWLYSIWLGSILATLSTKVVLKSLLLLNYEKEDELQLELVLNLLFWTFFWVFIIEFSFPYFFLY